VHFDARSFNSSSNPAPLPADTATMIRKHIKNAHQVVRAQVRRRGASLAEPANANTKHSTRQSLRQRAPQDRQLALRKGAPPTPARSRNTTAQSNPPSSPKACTREQSSKKHRCPLGRAGRGGAASRRIPPRSDTHAALYYARPTYPKAH